MLPFKIIPKKLRKSIYEDIKETFFQKTQEKIDSKEQAQILKLCAQKELSDADKTVLKKLIANAQYLNQSNDLGFTALHLIVTHHHHDLLDAVFAAQIDIEALTEDGARALNLAVSCQNTVALEALLQVGAYPDPIDAFGFFPLYTAVLQKDLESVKILLKYSANIHKEGPCSRSPVILATEMKAAEILEALLH